MAARTENHPQRRLQDLLAAARRSERLESEDLRFLLGLTDHPALATLFQAAREARAERFGNTVFLYGFVYFSTVCRNDCTFCHYRRDNRALPRYRKTLAEIVSVSQTLADAGVHLIDLTMGAAEPWAGRAAHTGHVLMESVRGVKNATGLPLMISPGVVSSGMLAELAQAGADWFACYQETHSRPLFARLRPGQSFDARWNAKLEARAGGLLIEEGVLSGVGETVADRVDSFEMIRILDPDQVRVMTFVPQPGTPMEHFPAPDSLQELVMIAVLRLTSPDRLIPASLDVAGLGGLELRLNAGANVVTSMIVPGAGLTGVAGGRDIEDSGRMPATVRSVLARCGLEPADPSAYTAWMQQRRRMVASGRTR